MYARTVCIEHRFSDTRIIIAYIVFRTFLPTYFCVAVLPCTDAYTLNARCVQFCSLHTFPHGLPTGNKAITHCRHTRDFSDKFSTSEVMRRGAMKMQIWLPVFIITSAKEGMFYQALADRQINKRQLKQCPVSAYLFVCQLTYSSKNYKSDLRDNFTGAELYLWTRIKFCMSSGSESGPRNFRNVFLPLWERGNTTKFADNSTSCQLFFSACDVSQTTNLSILVLIRTTIRIQDINDIFSIPIYGLF